MSIDTDATVSSTVDTPLVRAAITGTTNQKPDRWRRRSYQITAGLVALAVIAAVVANSLIARQFTADGAVRQYLGALQAGDANSAWNAIQVTAPTQPVVVSLTSQAALQAALSTSKPDIKSFAISGDTQLDSNTTAIAFTYDTSAGSKQAKAVVQRSGQTHFGIYPVWHLVVAPTLLQITLPKGSNGVNIDGKTISLPEGAKSTIAVLPLAHQVELKGTPLLESQTVSVDAAFSLDQEVVFQPHLTQAGMDKAKTAVKAAFATCARQTVPNADSGACPQSIGYSSTVSGQWQLLGDPTQDLTVTFDKDLNATGAGHFQMAFAYQSSGTLGTLHLPASGAYGASLILAVADMSVASIQPMKGLAPLQRPAGATDQAAKDLVDKAFKRCAAARAQSVADCPQQLGDAGPTNLRWSMKGDPLAGSTVTFDPNGGLYTVHGNFRMTASYTWFGYPKTGSSFVTAYDAYLFWDGQGLHLVTISGSTS
jgi:hypothetical protein